VSRRFRLHPRCTPFRLVKALISRLVARWKVPATFTIWSESRICPLWGRRGCLNSKRPRNRNDHSLAFGCDPRFNPAKPAKPPCTLSAGRCRVTGELVRVGCVVLWYRPLERFGGYGVSRVELPTTPHSQDDGSFGIFATAGQNARCRLRGTSYLQVYVFPPPTGVSMI